MAAVTIAIREDLARPWIAITAVVVALAITVTATVLLRRRAEVLLSPVAIVVELACGVGVVVVDGWAYEAGHVFGPSQTLGVVWPLSGVLSAGLALGSACGALAGLLFGPARLFDAWANGVDHFRGNRVLSMTSTGLVYALAGAVVGVITRLLRDAREEVAAAQAREDVSRTLHDGVLQTLAVIERRTGEPDIARLAREQERELRGYLFDVERGRHPGRGTDLPSALRDAIGRFEAAFTGRADLVVVDDLPTLSERQVEAVAGAVGEALTNAGKHGEASSVTVYVEGDDDGLLFCSVRDDGHGFDPAATADGVGLSRSIRGRMSEVGGRMELRSRPGEGAEVCLWLP